MNKIETLKEERAKVWKVQCDINDLAKKEERDLTPEETQAWEAADADFQRINDEIKKEQRKHETEQKRQAEFDKRMAYMNGSSDETLGAAGIVFNKENKNGERQIERFNPEKEWRYAESFDGYREQTGGKLATKEYRKAYNSYLFGGLGGPYSVLNDEEKRMLTEYRALQADSDTTGGFLVVPEQFIARVIQTKDNLLFIRPRATVIPVPTAASLGVPSLDNDPDDPDWTAEIRTGTEDSSMNFGKRELHPHPLAKRIKLSKKLIRVNRMNVESLVRKRLAYKFATAEENNFLNGSGSNRPLGVFTASNDGIGTGRDVSTGNTSTAMTADGLINAKYNLKAQYRRTSRWCFHRDGMKMIRKLKDGEGNYLWRQGLASDQADTILDLPFDESEYCPNTFTASQYVGILADWSFYWIADAMNMQVQVLTELYAETNQNGYIGRAETDGMPVLAEAFTRVKLGT